MIVGELYCKNSFLDRLPLKKLLIINSEVKKDEITYININITFDIKSLFR